MKKLWKSMLASDSNDDNTDQIPAVFCYSLFYVYYD